MKQKSVPPRKVMKVDSNMVGAIKKELDGPMDKVNRTTERLGDSKRSWQQNMEYGQPSTLLIEQPDSKNSKVTNQTSFDVTKTL